MLAPLSGWLVPLEQVPDPVFAGKLVGDGISLDPTSQVLLAPCDGRVSQLHSAGHATALTGPGGLEVLMHVGLDTVTLKGVGFTPRVQVGDEVKAGTPLLEFDADAVGRGARSLLTQIVITNSDRVLTWERFQGSVRGGVDPILRLIVNAPSPAEVAWGEPLLGPPVALANPHGLHARPAAVLAGLARQFECEARLAMGEQTANARSIVGLLGLQVSRGALVRVIARGRQAAEAVSVLTAALEGGLGEEVERNAPTPSQPAAAQLPEESALLRGVTASPGLAVGQIFQVRRREFEFMDTASEPNRERRALQEALEAARGELEALQTRLEDPGRAAIFAAHAELLEDPELRELAQGAMARGKSAPAAWKGAYSLHAERLAALPNELLAARATDLQDVGERVLRLLTGSAAARLDVPERTILVAEDLTPSDTAGLDRSRVLGFCTTRGGATSHVAILARSLDLPALAGMDPRSLELANGTLVVLDATQGCLRLDPSPEEQEMILERQQARDSERREQLLHAAEPATTQDGHRLEVVANIGGLAEAEQALAAGAEGVGLLRSEFLFMQRSLAPGEEEQHQLYAAIAAVLGPERPLVVRLLDIGGDKALPYLSIPEEENPFLGERGIRVLLGRPDLFRTHVRAILRAAGATRLHVMLPMVAGLNEWRAAKQLIERERNELGLAPVPLGIMVEVPSAALLAEVFAREVDFFSVGTNDLTQYVLAMDRGHPKLAAQVDPLSPAVFMLIARTVEAARRHSRWVGVCGGIAADPLAIPVLVGLGVDELSVSVPAIPAVKARIRELDRGSCQELAARVLAAADGQEVRRLVEELS